MRPLLLSAVAVTTLARLAVAEQAYHATRLYTGSGAVNSNYNVFPTDINNDGVISGYSVSAFNPTYGDIGVSWTPNPGGYAADNAITNTGTYSYGRMLGVSSNGLVSGYRYINSTIPTGHIGYASGGDANAAALAVGDLTAQGIRVAYGVNRDGRIIGRNNAGQLVTYQPGNGQVVRVLENVGDPEDFTAGGPAFRINDGNKIAGTLTRVERDGNGQVTGTFSNGYTQFVAPSGPVPPGGGFITNPVFYGDGSALYGINGDGAVAGEAPDGPAVWFNMTGKQHVTDGEFGRANDINARNQIVGRGIAGNGGLTGFLSVNGVTVDLNTLVTPGLNIREAIGINDRGQIIVRAGSNSNGAAYVLTPIAGTSQFTPVLPDREEGGVARFDGVASGQWFDPAGENALTYTMTEGSGFDAILEVPVGFENVSVTVDGVTTLLTAGGSFDFADGVRTFTIAWDSPSAADFPIKLAFNDATASFSIAAVPEPAGLTLVGVAAATLLRRRVIRR